MTDSRQFGFSRVPPNGGRSTITDRTAATTHRYYYPRSLTIVQRRAVRLFLSPPTEEFVGPFRCPLNRSTGTLIRYNARVEHIEIVSPSTFSPPGRVKLEIPDDVRQTVGNIRRGRFSPLSRPAVVGPVSPRDRAEEMGRGRRENGPRRQKNSAPGIETLIGTELPVIVDALS